MKIKFIETAKIKSSLERLMKVHEEFYWSVAWGSDGQMADLLLANKRKIRKIVFGTHFCQTAPDLLDRLQNCSGARVVPQTGKGTFHPKVFGFRSGTQAAVIIGSANFTNAGTGDNVEAAICLEGQVQEAPIAEALNFVNGLWRKWKIKGEITDEFLAGYRRQYEANRRLQRQLQSAARIPSRRSRQPHYDLLEMDWTSYERTISEAVDASNIGARLSMLEKAHVLLNGRRFRDLPTVERRAIAGIATRKQVANTSVDNFDWGWFGSMFGAGGFQNRINENDSHISDALGFIPSTGLVTKENFESYCQEFMKAFVNADRTPDVATGTRLLAIKRPDYFVCLDGENEKELGVDLGFAYSTLELTQYWDKVVEPITQTSWWRSDEPPGQAGLLWQARAAMLDVLYYQH